MGEPGALMSKCANLVRRLAISRANVRLPRSDLALSCVRMCEFSARICDLLRECAMLLCGCADIMWSDVRISLSDMRF